MPATSKSSLAVLDARLTLLEKTYDNRLKDLSSSISEVLSEIKVVDKVLIPHMAGIENLYEAQLAELKEIKRAVKSYEKLVTIVQTDNEDIHKSINSLAEKLDKRDKEAEAKAERRFKIVIWALTTVGSIITIGATAFFAWMFGN